MSNDSRISPYNLADCKNTTDDALQNYLKSLKIEQSHYYADVRLALGYAAVIISAITFAFDYKLGFESTKYWTAAAVAVYFALNGAFTYWMWAVEKDIIFTGNWKGQQLIISTRTEKMDPTYRVTARYSKAGSSSQYQEVQIDAPFMQWFTADGYFVAKPFQQWLASSVPVITEADPKNAVQNASKGAAETQTVEVGGVAAALDGLATGSKKEAGSKRRKA